MSDHPLDPLIAACDDALEALRAPDSDWHAHIERLTERIAQLDALIEQPLAAPRALSKLETAADFLRVLDAAGWRVWLDADPEQPQDIRVRVGDEVPTMPQDVVWTCIGVLHHELRQLLLADDHVPH